MIDPAVQSLLDRIAQRGQSPTHLMTPEEARRTSRERRPLSQPVPPDIGLARELDGPVPMRLFRPLGSVVNERLPALVYFHGGGWMLGDLDSHDTLCRELCNSSGCVVIAVEYRLAPEHRFPSAVDDALAATRWVHEAAHMLNIDAARMAVGGDSAGGNLAAVVAIAARDAGDLPIAYQLLIYPVTDLRARSQSHTTNGEGYLITSQALRYFNDNYLSTPDQVEDWRASPLLAADLSHLPPALVLTAGFDPLHDEGLAYAHRLSAAGNIASHVCFERQIHGFITMGNLIPEANTAVTLCAAELRRALHRRLP